MTPRNISTVFFFLFLMTTAITALGCADEVEAPSDANGGFVEEPPAEPDAPSEPEAPVELDSIARVLANSPDFSTLLTAAEAAGVVGALGSDDGEFTLFAPTDEAFSKLDDGLLEDLLADTEELTKVLLYHAVASDLLAEEVATLDTMTTASGQEITVELVGADVVLNGSVKVIATDTLCSNGVIHSIDGVLIPPDLMIDDEMTPSDGSGCYSGPPNHMCDCSIAEDDCEGIWTDGCMCGT
jgi:uncharacterized surface protein with fasciclin (FAS1) repeats